MVKEELKKLSYVEVIAIIVTIIAAVYYTYLYGWSGFAYSVLSFVLGIMIVAYFADHFPIIGPLIRRWERSGRKDQ